ncbi:MAG: ATP-grasp domain-containing protein [Gemmataceae bacterium]|nr:ATP-grasp domain-containing protein [Gemmataceae bacterium]
MPTLVLTPRFTEDAQALWRAASRRGWDVERLPGWRVPEELRSVPEPVLYLEALFGPALAERFGLRLEEPPDDWLPSLPWEYRKREVRLMTLGEARSMEEAAFMKPPNDKSFQARVYAGHELPAGEDGQAVLVAEPVAWEKEFRCFVLERKMATFSAYLRDGVLQREAGFPHTAEEEAELSAFIGGLLADTRVPLGRTAVLDAGVIAGRGWAVVEQNSAWGAGLYGCDPERVLDVLREAAVPE